MSRGKSRSMSGSAVSSSLRKRPRKSSLVDRVDVREAGEVADDRGHGRARARGPAAAARAPTSGPRTSTATSRASSSRSRCRRKKPARPERVDDPQLLLEARVRRGRVRRCPPGSARRSAPSTARPAARSRLLVLRAGVAVAEVAAQVEAQARRRAAPVSATALRVVGEAGGHRRRRGEHVGEVAAAHAAPRRPASCGGAGRRTRPAAARARARARGRCPWPRVGTPSRAGQLGQRAVARAVVALEGALELDPQRGRGRRPRAAGAASARRGRRARRSR